MSDVKQDSHPVYSAAPADVELQTGLLSAILRQDGGRSPDEKSDATLGVTVDPETGKVSIHSPTEITLSVAGGLSRIRLTPDGIVLEGLQIKQLAEMQLEVRTMVNKVLAQLNHVTSALHRFHSDPESEGGESP